MSMATPAKSLKLRLPPDQTSPVRARQALARADPTGIAGPSNDRVQLVLSELVTNALEHARFLDEEQVAVSVRWTGSWVRVEVEDPGPCFERTGVSEPELSTPGGWGLFLVGKLCDRW